MYNLTLRGAMTTILLFLVNASQASIAPRTYVPLRTGAVTPNGWLLKQLKLQAEGLKLKARS